MNWKEIVKKRLEETRELSDYISDDFQACKILPILSYTNEEINICQNHRHETFSA